jgi:hypothetical protein
MPKGTKKKRVAKNPNDSDEENKEVRLSLEIQLIIA